MFRVLKYFARRQIAKVSVQPGDVIVLKSEADVTAETGEQIAADLHEIFPGHKVVILGEGNKLQVVPHNCKGCGEQAGRRPSTTTPPTSSR